MPLHVDREADQQIGHGVDRVLDNIFR